MASSLLRRRNVGNVNEWMMIEEDGDNAFLPAKVIRRKEGVD